MHHSIRCKAYSGLVDTQAQFAIAAVETAQRLSLDVLQEGFVTALQSVAAGVRLRRRQGAMAWVEWR